MRKRKRKRKRRIESGLRDRNRIESAVASFAMGAHPPSFPSLFSPLLFSSTSLTSAGSISLNPFRSTLTFSLLFSLLSFLLSFHSSRFSVLCSLFSVFLTLFLFSLLSPLASRLSPLASLLFPISPLAVFPTFSVPLPVPRQGYQLLETSPPRLLRDPRLQPFWRVPLLLRGRARYLQQQGRAGDLCQEEGRAERGREPEPQRQGRG